MRAEIFDACLISSWDEIWGMSQNETWDMSHVTRFVVSQKYSLGMIELLLTEHMRYIDKKFSWYISQSSILPLLANLITVRQA